MKDLSIPHMSREDVCDILKFGRTNPIFQPGDLFYYMQSFVHKSIPEDVKNCEHMEYMEESNEVLEMVGDSLYSAAVSIYLKNIYNKVDEGQLSKIRSRIVCGKQMSRVAKAMNFGKYILVSNSVVNAKSNDRFLEDCFEAFVYAIYMDKGFEGVCKFAFNVINTYIPYDTFTTNTNYKDILIHFTKVFDIEDLVFNNTQEDIIIDGKPVKRFIVYVSMNGRCFPPSEPQRKKKDAEQEASRIVLEMLQITEEMIEVRRQLKRSSPKV